MDISKKYSHLVVEDTYVVWLKRVHRFIQFKEPAFFVFEQCMTGTDPQVIAGYCRKRYDLPAKEAARFVREIISETKKLTKAEVKVKIKKEIVNQNKVEAEDKIKAKAAEEKRKYYEHLCRIGGKTILFRYGDEVMEGVFRPLFEQFELIKVKAETKAKISGETGESIELFSRKDAWCIGINGVEVHSFPEEDWEHFHGAVYTELLNLLHGKKLEEWMGVFHAAAVVQEKKGRRDEGTLRRRDLETERLRDGEMEGLRDEEMEGLRDEEAGENQALIFLGESGAGKSTVAAILMAQGYRVLTDDFLPVGIPKNAVNNTPLIYPMPAAISVKKNAIPILLPWYPEMEEEAIFAAEEEEYETYLPLSGNAGDLSPIPAKAIFFIKYDPTVDFRLTRESNLERMNAFLKQSWIANNTAAAEAFLKWYFSLPVYSLVYSDAEKLINGLNSL